MSAYIDGFSDWASVQSAFEMNEPEPDQVIVAEYSGGYEADAYVLFRRGRQYFEVVGSHCSCYGLEGQWEPGDPLTKTALRQMMKRIVAGPTARHAALIEAALAA